MVTEIIGELEGKGKALNQYSRFNDLPLEYDSNGNLSAKGSRLFAYDYRNRLIRSSKGDDAVTFTYDIFGRQTSRTDVSGTQHFFYAGDQKIEERNGSGQVTKQYVWGNGIDELLRLDVFNGSSSTPYYIHTDNIGSTTAITDGNGNLVERVTYDVYGAPTFTDALGQTLKKSTIRNTTLFQGREYDYDLAIYNYRARYFDPIMGRFLQTDPLGYQDSMNLYQGMGMNPVNFVDPWGEYGIDYHYYVVGFLILMKGWDMESASEIAGWSQYVDENSKTDSFDLFHPEVVAYYHFPGSTKKKVTLRNPLWVKQRVQKYANEYLNHIEGSDVRLGRWLHTYADSWAHEGFTGYGSNLNKRTGSIRPNIGHADADWGGHAPDVIALDVEKALEAAKQIYQTLPKGPSGEADWEQCVEPELREIFTINKYHENYKKAEKIIINSILQKELLYFGDILKFDSSLFKKKNSYFEKSLGFYAR